MRRSSSNQSKNFTTKRRTRIIIRSVVSIITVFIVVTVIFIFSSWSVLTLTNVQVSGVDQKKVVAIHDIVIQSLLGKYIGLFSRANYFIYPRDHIKQLIKDAYFEIDEVDITRADWHTVTVSVHEKTPLALVCATLPDFNGNELSLNDPGTCYFVDGSGVIFKKAPSFSGTVYNRYYIPDLSSGDNTDTSSSTALIGTYATSTDEFHIIQQLYATIKQNNIIADAMLMKGGGEYELYIRNPNTSSSTAVVYFDTISSTTEQLSNFISFWNHTLVTARAKNESVEFDYIDVRYSPNVYHRFTRQN